MQADELRRLVLVEMAAHDFARPFMQLGEVIRFGEDRFANGTRGKPAFRGLLDNENDFAHDRIVAECLSPICRSVHCRRPG